MTKIKPAQGRGQNLFHNIGGGVVGEMAMSAENALLEAPGPAAVVLQHFDVMVGFQQEDVGLADALDDQLGGVAQVGQESDIAGGCADQEGGGVIGIMRHGEGVHRQVTDLDGIVEALRRNGVQIRVGVVTGVSVRQAVLQDPSGNLIELFEPLAGYHERTHDTAGKSQDTQG